MRCTSDILVMKAIMVMTMVIMMTMMIKIMMNRDGNKGRDEMMMIRIDLIIKMKG